MTYAIVSDLHLHNWSQFSVTDDLGVNSRLKIILDQLEQSADNLLKSKGNRLYIAGDVFHVRNSLEPSTLNPTLDCIAGLVARGVDVRVIPGNHDLGTRHTTWNSNASSSFASLGVKVVVEPTYFEDDNVVMLPWEDSVKGIRKTMIEWADKHPGSDCILHSPLNGVIRGIPDTGLEPTQLKELGFNRIFCGHYHNHVNFFDRVYSVGALTHQTWGDVGTLAGYLLVDNDSVRQVESTAPKFIDYDASNRTAINGNYVRAKAEITSSSEVSGYEQALKQLGAAGVVIHPIVKPKQTRTESTVQAGASIETSIRDWISANKPDQLDAVFEICSDILQEAS